VKQWKFGVEGKPWGRVRGVERSSSKPKANGLQITTGMRKNEGQTRYKEEGSISTKEDMLSGGEKENGELARY